MKIEIDLGDLDEDMRAYVRKFARDQAKTAARDFINGLFVSKYDDLAEKVNGVIAKAVADQMKPAMDEGMARMSALLDAARIEASAKMRTEHALAELEKQLQGKVASIAQSVFHECMNAKYKKKSASGVTAMIPLHELIQASVVGILAKVEMEAEKAARDSAA